MGHYELGIKLFRCWSTCQLITDGQICPVREARQLVADRGNLSRTRDVSTYHGRGKSVPYTRGQVVPEGIRVWLREGVLLSYKVNSK